MKGSPGYLPAALGFIVLLAGLLLLGTSAWQWHLNTPLEEPANPGQTPNPSTFSFSPQDGMTPAKVEQVMEKDRTQRSEEQRRARLLNRLYGYAFPPAGLLLFGTGFWLLTTDHRKNGAN
jgi:hypothetical protein